MRSPVALAMISALASSAVASGPYQTLTQTCQSSAAVSGKLSVSSASACLQLCDDESRCVAVDSDGTSCYLKGHCEGTAGQCSGWCGYRKVDDMCSATPVSGLDCKDNDMDGGHKSGVSTADDCCSLCSDFAGCTTWTYYASQKNCYLKSACDNPVTKDSVSGGVVTPTPSPPPSPPPPPSPSPPFSGKTTVGISGDKWTINGEVTHKGTSVEGLLLNARLINGIFDDSNSATRSNWAYPDTGRWDPDRNTGEFVGNMSMWRDAGMLSFTIGLQGGSPHCYGNNGWKVSAFNEDGSLKDAWMQRLRRVLDEADSLGMVPIVQYFYYASFPDVQSHAKAAVTSATEWLSDTGLRNFVVEAYNEKCDSTVSSFVDVVHSVSKARGRSFLVSTSCGGGGKAPSDSDIAKFDFVLLHGNGQQPSGVSDSVTSVKKKTHKPIVYNEDDHGDFSEGDDSNLMSAVSSGASWGHLCCCDGSVQGDYATGYQCPPVAWNAHGGCEEGPAGNPQPKGSKAAWFAAVARLTRGTFALV